MARAWLLRGRKKRVSVMIMTIQRSVIACLALAAIAASATTLSGPAAAQSEPAGGDQQLEKLIKELRNELKRGESDRLIDPWYLRDLRKVLGRYENPCGKRLFSDNFSGRCPQPDPPWQVTAAAIAAHDSIMDGTLI